MRACLPRVLIATTNPGKLREFSTAAGSANVIITSVPGLTGIRSPVEDGMTFEDNARIKAQYYSRHAEGELVLAEDSGLVVEALGGQPGIYSARYAALLGDGPGDTNSNDEDNNKALISGLDRLGAAPASAKYVCVIAIARNGITLATFSGETHGKIITAPRGNNGFGYDPLFFFPDLGKTFAELSPEEKYAHSHRGKAFQAFLGWLARNHESAG